MKIDIIGAGSIGLLLAGKLIQSGNGVRLWCRSEEQSRALKHSGLGISYENGQAAVVIAGDTFSAASVHGFAEAYLHEPGDWTAITVKQNALHYEMPEIFSPLSGSRLNILCFQNGYGHLEFLRELLPEASIWAAVTTEAAKRKTANGVIHAGKGELYIGKDWNSKKLLAAEKQEEGNTSVRTLIKQLRSAGFSAHLSNDMDTMIYRKLLINAVINPLTAIWRIRNGELLASEERIQLMKELYKEAISVYDACGIRYEDGAWENILSVCRATSGNISSMLADVTALRATEVRWINGYIVDMGERCGVQVPLNRWVCRMVEGMMVRER
ncbi:2-dehydropantoate 2-reductase [Paenibacillus sp. PK3_47]|uniref:ketopantoate reductase family protein n=1 Tax=Paenibacillus sp. PK3_47 TaxID=2072642 RepID=UPI00201E11F3|nr:ketopantoate reductase family protein [Paenibacillus sp. PK3_47]UQZ32897.1 2-dehydropantoate 2-reductase [Paenibacillus sp. PK3_47]